MSTLINPSNKVENIATGKLWWVALVAGVAAFIVNLILFLIAQSLGLSLMVSQPADPNTLVPLSMGPILGASIVPAIAAAILLAILGRFLARPLRIFQIIAVVFLLLSFGGPFSLPVETSTKVVLGVMHVVTAVAIVGTLSTLGREK